MPASIITYIQRNDSSIQGILIHINFAAFPNTITNESNNKRSHQRLSPVVQFSKKTKEAHFLCEISFTGASVGGYELLHNKMLIDV
jgi:hypothetical protein